MKGGRREREAKEKHEREKEQGRQREEEEGRERKRGRRIQRRIQEGEMLFRL